jgi:hypothetical protein
MEVTWSQLELEFLDLNKAKSFTYDHRLRRTSDPVRSRIIKPQIGRLVVGWVTTSEYLLLYVFALFFWPRSSRRQAFCCWNKRARAALRYRVTQPLNLSSFTRLRFSFKYFPRLRGPRTGAPNAPFQLLWPNNQIPPPPPVQSCKIQHSTTIFLISHAIYAQNWAWTN